MLLFVVQNGFWFDVTWLRKLFKANLDGQTKWGFGNDFLSVHYLDKMIKVDQFDIDIETSEDNLVLKIFWISNTADY